jgi:phosphatidylglycerol:prolipoprotein diacylglycerol transferase
VLPVLFRLGPVSVFTYGALIALGGVLSAAFWRSRRAAMGLRKDDDFWLLLNVILLGGFIGGRLLFLLEYVPFSRGDLARSAFSFNQGFSVLGAFGGVTLGLWLFCRRLNLEFARLLDYVSLAAPFWHFLGRLGCLAAGCCYGRPASLPWAVTFTDPRCLVAREFLGRSLHPTQLYEAFGELLIGALLYRFALPPLERGRLPPGTLSGWYFVSYGMLRFSIEFFRGDSVPFVLGLTAGQALSLALAGLGAAILCTRS